MAQFDVYLNQNVRTNPHIPYLVDVQTDILEKLQTRLVVPLEAIPSTDEPIERLNPVFDIRGLKVALVPTEISSVPIATLTEVVTNLGERRDDIVGAIDFLLWGQ